MAFFHPNIFQKVEGVIKDIELQSDKQLNKITIGKTGVKKRENAVCLRKGSRNKLQI